MPSCDFALWKCGKRPLRRWKADIHGPMEKPPAFPQLRKHDRLRTFPQRLLRRISFLSDPDGKRKKRTKKETGASPSAQTEGGAPALLWKSVQNSLFAPLKSEGATPICTLFRACGLVMGTGDEDCPETLLAGMDTALADLVVPAAAVLPQEEGPFQPPLFAPAHRSCSGGFFC